MVKLESRALETLDEITPAWTDLVVPEPPKVGAIASDPVALMSDVGFSWDDPEILVMI